MPLNVLSLAQEQPSAKQSFVSALSNSLPRAIEALGVQNREQKLLENERQRMSAENKSLGIPENVYNPKLREAHLEGQIKKQQQQQEFDTEENNYKTIENTFGKKFADTWRASPTGGRTELLKAAVDAKLRGLDIDKLFQGLPSEQEKNVAEDKNEEYPEIPEEPGLKPAERVKLRAEYRKENKPIYDTARTKLKALKDEGRSIKKLQDLNPKIPDTSDFSRYLINKDTGEPYKIAELVGVVSPEVQEWVKVINDFTTKAKDSYGARVTNFDLQQYMKRLPGLMNTTEGRRRILRMMEINNEMDQLYNSELKNIYRNYGAGNISPEMADEIAEQKIASRISELESEFENIELENESFQGESLEELPPAQNYPNRVIEDENGVRYKSDGRKWVKV